MESKQQRGITRSNEVKEVTRRSRRLTVTNSYPTSNWVNFRAIFAPVFLGNVIRGKAKTGRCWSVRPISCFAPIDGIGQALSVNDDLRIKYELSDRSPRTIIGNSYGYESWNMYVRT